jgi:heme/copper-type cytochrome/quinol oxidase subunit 4
MVWSIVITAGFPLPMVLSIVITVLAFLYQWSGVLYNCAGFPLPMVWSIVITVLAFLYQWSGVL